jgi:hypothetical protein
MNDDDSVSRLRKWPKCRRQKYVSEFRPDRRTKNGRHYRRNQCRECENKAWRRDWLAGKKGRQSAMVLAVNAPPVLRNSEGVNAKLEQAIGLRMLRHQSDALDEIYTLATMPVSENSMLSRIKFAAATLLAGPLLFPEATAGFGDLEKTLRDLDALFHREAPRINC